MPLIETGNECSSQNCHRCPPGCPPHIPHRGQGCAPCAKKQDAQDGVADDVASFANEEVPLLEVRQVHTENEMQQGI